MTSVLTSLPRVAMMALGLGAAAIAAGACAVETDEIEWDDYDDEDTLDDEEGADGLDEDGEIDPDSVPLICQPDEIDGAVTRLSLDANGVMRARGKVWSNVAPCNVTVFVELRRNGQRIDSASKACGDESCSSRLLSARNPPGSQEFCALVRQTSTGSLLDKQCKTR